ncbi:DUF7344 domain-containing protein [Haloarcula brevis]
MSSLDKGLSQEETDIAGELFPALAKKRRRIVLQYLHESGDESVTFEALVEHLVERESCGDDRERVAVRLHHMALPKLADVGVVEYDQRSGCVRYRPNQLLETLLKAGSENGTW